MAPIRILLVEDNPFDAELLQKTLICAGVASRITRVETEQAFAQTLRDDYEVIVSDYAMPTFNGDRALFMAKGLRPDLPFIFLSGTMGEEVAVQSLRNGATDYVLKDNMPKIVPAIQRSLKEFADRKARDNAERQLKETLEQLKNLFDNLDEMFFSYDFQSNKLLQISPACQKIYGISQEQFYANPQIWRQAVHVDDRALVEEAIASLRQNLSVSCQYRIVFPDGKVHWAQAKMKLVTDSAGRGVRMDGIVSDISERRELEAKFFRSQRVEKIGNLAGGIAHDLNNMLTPIVIGLDSLRSQPLATEAVATLNTMETCVRRGATLLNQLLTFAAGVGEQPVATDVGRLIRSVESILRQTFPRSIDIVTHADPDTRKVLATTTQLEQVLMNLCVNSRDAMPDGGTLTISARNDTAENIVIEVQDTGHGIPRQIVSKVFDTFFTTKAPAKGTGLGLSTVRTIVHNLGGTVHVASEAGHTVFCVYLPVTLEPDNLAERPPSDTIDAPVGHGELILVAEDEAAVRDLIRTVLENYGYRVIVTSDGFEALGAFQEHADSVRLILTDHDMPRLTGIDMIKTLVDMKSKAKVILMSGLLEGGILKNAPAGSVRAALQKPFAPADLLWTVHRIIHS